MHVCVCVLVTQLCPTLWDPMDCNSTGSSVHGILQTRILEWVATSFFRGSSQPKDWIQISHIEGRLFTIWAIREALWFIYNVVLISAGETGDSGSTPQLGISLGGGLGNPLQHPCLENLMGRGAEWMTVSKYWKWLKWLSVSINQMCTYMKILNIAPQAIQWDLVVYP